MCGYNTMSFITLTCAVGQAFRKGTMGCRWSLLHEAWGLSYEDWEAGGHLVARLGDHLRACSTLLSGRWCWLLARTSAGVLSPSTSVWPRHVACASSHHGGLGEAVLPTWGLGAPKAGVPAHKGEAARPQPQKSHSLTYATFYSLQVRDEHARGQLEGSQAPLGDVGIARC